MLLSGHFKLYFPEAQYSNTFPVHSSCFPMKKKLFFVTNIAIQSYIAIKSYLALSCSVSSSFRLISIHCGVVVLSCVEVSIHIGLKSVKKSRERKHMVKSIVDESIYSLYMANVKVIMIIMIYLKCIFHATSK